MVDNQKVVVAVDGRLVDGRMVDGRVVDGRMVPLG